MTIQRYHQRTRHQIHRYAAGPNQLDWKNQPDPFRTYQGAPKLRLPLVADELTAEYDLLYKRGGVAPFIMNLRNVAAMLEISFGLSAWKQFGEQKWALRCNPSSGNLHPTEAYVVTTDLPGLPAGVYHYNSREHSLYRRMTPDDKFADIIFGRLMIGLSSVIWREAWKYGERAYRYCQLDIGHAIAAVRFACATLGWHAIVVTDAADADIASILGIDQDHGDIEKETPEVLLLIEPGAGHFGAMGGDITQSLAEAAKNCEWRGTPNMLSVFHTSEWDIAEEAAIVAEKPRTDETRKIPPIIHGWLPAPTHDPAATVIRNRRSSQYFDGETHIEKNALFRMLSTLLPRPHTGPWDALPWPSNVHPVLYVHRVKGLDRGIYILVRNPESLPELQQAMNPGFAWVKPEGTPDWLGFYQLAEGDARNFIRSISCHQEIASDGAFAASMIAQFDEPLEKGAWWYRRLMWEAGMIGQALYLEATALGIAGTGIGCFFDQECHDLLGIKDTMLQILYNFTVGEPMEDSRLVTHPPYEHLGG